MKFSALFPLAISALNIAPATEAQGGNDRIVGGRPSRGYSFMASVQVGGGHFCGGTLVAPNVVVTAAHCLERHHPSQLNVRLGITRLSQGGENLPVSQTFIHPGYNTPRFANDVGVIILASPSRYSPANLDTSNIGSRVGTAAINAGWGHLYHQGQTVDQLMEVDLRISDNSRCARQFQTFSERASICMSGATPTQTPCNGDSGGPLTVGNTLIGIVSYGYSCRGDSVFARVNTYVNWINQYIR